jgi:hypothetical protein
VSIFVSFRVGCREVRREVEGGGSGTSLSVSSLLSSFSSIGCLEASSEREYVSSWSYRGFDMVIERKAASDARRSSAGVSSGMVARLESGRVGATVDWRRRIPE